MVNEGLNGWLDNLATEQQILKKDILSIMIELQQIKREKEYVLEEIKQIKKQIKEAQNAFIDSK